MELVKLNGVTNFTKVKLGKQTNYLMEFVRQGKMICDKQNQFWIDTHSFKTLEILTKGINTKVSKTYELKISSNGSIVTVIMEPPLEGTLLLNGDPKVLTLDSSAALYLLPNGTYPVLFTPANPDMSPVTSSVTVNN